MKRIKAIWRAGLTGLAAALILAAAADLGRERQSGRPELTAGASAKPQTGSKTQTPQITGKVLFEGQKPKLATIAMDQDPVCVASHKEPVHFEDGAVNADGTLPNVFVYVKTGLPSTYPAPKEPVILDQKGCLYEPHVLGIMASQELRVISSDPTTHNVHPMPKNNQQWNRSQPPGAAPLVWRFANPEIMIPVKCNLHPWMKAYIGVTSNPFYSVTGSGGTFTIRGLPPGDYTIGAWTATFGTQEQEVTVPASGSTTADFTFKAP